MLVESWKINLKIIGTKTLNNRIVNLIYIYDLLRKCRCDPILHRKPTETFSVCVCVLTFSKT